ncbi:MAG: 4-(cytidine 5'-diphospho)-2-C-methyl-D-erythritol kinase [Acidobacteria bacterium]|uniref:4-diphosphocytidyl-2-C-methyl-D-erythritol kinase n=1 Tax=Candidatus Polarisedimenticola svalbardensis TaxID=2886004 RepID=A0A8J6XPV9_9BACT|nr:4-(cytidine 5'-diphospho)-2-C-methyl-D-erythritol kinase [Candidatus Polarisedimenticola svalbardensis]
MSGPEISVHCPGKINWSLRILGKREDEFHELATVLQAIDLWDTLTIREADTLALTCDSPGIPVDETNLVIRAARALADRAGIGTPGAAIHLEKRIPAGGGLGGGSSDAAGALLGLARAWSLDPGPAELAEIAAELGSDVPFFLSGGTALCTGRGEQVEPLPFAGEVPLLLGFPPVSISTAQVYDRLSAYLTLPANGVNLSALRALKLPGNKDFGFAINDLEPVVFAGWPELRLFRDSLLEHGARHAMLSGSGSTVFGVFEDQDGMIRAGEKLSGLFRHWELFRTRTVAHGHHPDQGFPR